MSNIFYMFYSAFYNTPNLYKSICGENIINNFSNDKSEFCKNHWDIQSIIELMSDIFFPSLPFSCPSWCPHFFKKMFFGGSSTFIKSFKEEKDDQFWIYVNGILTNKKIIEMNRILLEDVFDRPIHVVHNDSDSIVVDLIECLVGKQYEDLTEPAFVTLMAITKKLLDNKIKKIVIICHSQGTIVVGNVINSLKKMGFIHKKYLKKLEIYAVANCATNMEYILKNEQLPYIESFSNENDFVSRFGCNASDDIKKSCDIKIDGSVIIIPNKHGHMFNSHYFNNFENEYQESKLHRYLPN